MYLRKRSWLARKLFFRLRAMILVHMQVAERVDEFSRFTTEDSRDDHREKRVARDVEGHAEENIGASLIQLQTYFSVLDVHLVEVVANREPHSLARLRHAVEILGIPSSHDRVVSVRIFAQFFDHPAELVYRSAIMCRPTSPELPVNVAQFPMLLRKSGIFCDLFYEGLFGEFGRSPFCHFFVVNLVRIVVPNMDIVVDQVLYVGLAGKEPVEFVKHALPVDLFCGKQRQSLRKIEADLPTEHAVGLYAGSRVHLLLSVFEPVASEIEVLVFRMAHMKRLFAGTFFRGNKMFPVVLREASCLFITLGGRRRESGKRDLRDLHSRAQDDGDIALVCDLEGDVQKVSRIDDASGIVDHETDARER